MALTNQESAIENKLAFLALDRGLGIEGDRDAYIFALN
jgi:hypothetical protein